ncbi:hypothetical protein [Kosmotoga pacifica]|nr:hypothetical protein [Kosmotoga pacifica]
MLHDIDRVGVPAVILCSHKSHRPAHSQKEALEELRSNAGILYDPDGVSVIESSFKEISSLIKAQTDNN